MEKKHLKECRPTNFVNVYDMKGTRKETVSRNSVKNLSSDSRFSAVAESGKVRLPRATDPK